MNSPDPRLEKLVSGAQRHVADPGYESARSQRALRALGDYERKKAAVLTKYQDKPASTPAAAPKKRKVRVVRDDSGAITGFEAAD